MTKVTGGDTQGIFLMPESLDFGGLESDGSVVSHSATNLLIAYAGFSFEFIGEGMGGFDGDGWPTTGAFTSLLIKHNGDQLESIENFKVGVPLFRSLMETHDTSGVSQALFGGRDKMNGGGVADALYGYGGNDYINGKNGDDVIDGGSGQDQLIGAGGVDTFIFDAAADSTAAAPDLIVGMQKTDSIDLSGIDADKHTAGDQAFTIIHTAFTGTEGELRLTFDKVTRITTIQGDVDGDGHADLTIQCSGGDRSDFTNFVL